MARRFAALVGIALLIAACAPRGAAEPLPDGASQYSMTVDGLNRSYRVYRPPGLAAAAPLVVMMHGGFGTAANAEKRYGWDELAESAKFVVAYPDGASRAWNAGGGCCGRSAVDGVDDVGFITAMVADIRRRVAVDQARIYATGISNGGIMAYTLACNTDLFAAIGPTAATQLDPCPAPHPTSVLHIHGTADRNIRYDGGPGIGVAHIDGLSVPDVNAFWRNADQCAPPAVSTERRLTTSAAECPDGRGVQLITVDGGGHEWPAFATATLWNFFTAHPG